MSSGPRLALCLEQTLGHRAHGLNLEAAAAREPHPPEVLRVEYPEHPRLRMPWAVRGSARARALVAARARRLDVTLFHTQTISLFAPVAVRGGRYVVSLDATPAQLDAMGEWYRHARSAPLLERMKRAWYRSILGRAAGVVAWSEWAARSLSAEYGVARTHVLVAHPGAGGAFFAIPRREASRRPRILFVGGDFERKGGPGLLRAFAPLAGRAELVLVTEADVPADDGITVLRGVRPGTAAQAAAFAEADIFCLPTLGDCTSVAIGEAMAAGLPVITTAVGSNEETVRDGETGLVIPAGHATALAGALRRLVDDADLRLRLGRAARDDAHERMDAAANAARVIAYMREAAA